LFNVVSGGAAGKALIEGIGASVAEKSAATAAVKSVVSAAGKSAGAETKLLTGPEAKLLLTTTTKAQVEGAIVNGAEKVDSAAIGAYVKAQNNKFGSFGLGFAAGVTEAKAPEASGISVPRPENTASNIGYWAGRFLGGIF
jgi:hypothetical protein